MPIYDYEFITQLNYPNVYSARNCMNCSQLWLMENFQSLIYYHVTCKCKLFALSLVWFNFNVRVFFHYQRLRVIQWWQKRLLLSKLKIKWWKNVCDSKTCLVQFYFVTLDIFENYNCRCWHFESNEERIFDDLPQNVSW